MLESILSKRFLTASIFLAVTWLLMVGSLNPQEAVVGVVAAMVIAYLSYSHLAFLDDIKLGVMLPVHILRYLAVFLKALVASNFDMARRVILPSLPIFPAVVEVHTNLHSPLGKLLLANSITLTPGTLTIDVEGDTLRVHWIDARGMEDLVQATRAIAERFEIALSEILR